MSQSSQTLHPDWVPVPVPNRVFELVQDAFPESICQSVMDAEDAAREIRRFRPTPGALLDKDDQADREAALARLARANKVLGAYNPGLIVKAGGPRG